MNDHSEKTPFDLSALRVLVVDDEPDICRGIARLVQSTGAYTVTASSGEEALKMLDQSEIDLVLSDIKMRGISGIDLLQQITSRWQRTLVVLITGFGTIELAVACLQQGAVHFMTKPFDNNEVILTVQRFGKKILLEKQSREQVETSEMGIIAHDRKMKNVMELVDQVAATKVPILISGESGTGKELIARAIHARSRVSDKPFLAVNCAALPDTLLESELFGYKRGAFTGAHKDHQGIFRQVGGGSVLLDEIPSMSLAFQGKLLRVLQEKVIRPLGATADEEVDFRIICTTNRDLKAMVDAREFREDLYYRLKVFAIALPPLRERVSDIPALAKYFLRRDAAVYLEEDQQAPELSSDALGALMHHAWQGNVRELENVIQHALITCRGSQILPHHLNLHETQGFSATSPDETKTYEMAKQEVVERFQRQFIQRILEQTHGNISHAAEACGLTRVALQKLLKKLQIDRKDFKEE